MLRPFPAQGAIASAMPKARKSSKGLDVAQCEDDLSTEQLKQLATELKATIVQLEATVAQNVLLQQFQEPVQGNTPNSSAVLVGQRTEQTKAMALSSSVGSRAAFHSGSVLCPEVNSVVVGNTFSALSAERDPVDEFSGNSSVEVASSCDINGVCVQHEDVLKEVGKEQCSQGASAIGASRPMQCNPVKKHCLVSQVMVKHCFKRSTVQRRKKKRLPKKKRKAILHRGSCCYPGNQVEGMLSGKPLVGGPGSLPEAGCVCTSSGDDHDGAVGGRLGLAWVPVYRLVQQALA